MHYCLFGEKPQKNETTVSKGFVCWARPLEKHRKNNKLDRSKNFLTNIIMGYF